ncbi:uncharacterized protein [Dysidea avara]|uniref:uncharacterized protein n=1 Tax=Dysidea avara TaxID=196820 RepID=UPI003318C3A2
MAHQRQQQESVDTTQTAAVQQGTLFMKMKQQELLPDDVMAEWEDLGFQLDFTANQLDTISSNHDEKAVETCCREMLKKWSKQYKLPSPQAAKQLITAIHKADNNYYAEQLKTEIQGGQEFSQKYLLTTVVEQIACDWRDVGIYLGVNVDNIEKEHNATKAKFEEMMSTWLKNQTDPEPVIYEKLYKALVAADQIAAAERFKEKVEMQTDIN